VPFDPSQLEIVSREDAEQIFDRFSLNEIAEAWCAYHSPTLTHATGGRSVA
jgi:hypothetical protein